MAEFFLYSQLTFPEIAALPRDIPLLIPLGAGYDLQRVAESLEAPPSVGLLPAIPYGWPGSGLAVSEQALTNLLQNLLDSLRDDGFTRIYCLVPQGLNLPLHSGAIHSFHPSQVEAAQHIPADGDRDKVIIIPVGHTEQHAYHLPVSTDTLIIQSIAEGMAAWEPGLCAALPVFPYGVSTHRPSFAGTLNCGGRAFEDFFIEVVNVLAGRGFDRFYLVNGHGGNHSYLVNIVKTCGERHRHIFGATSWLYLSGEAGIAALGRYRSSPIGGMGHAGELETSLILHLRPEQVHMDRVVDETDFVATPNYYMDWVEGGALIANPPWDDDTLTGAYGAGSLATAEKGRLWLEAAIAEKVEHVGEIHEQQRRREARRAAGFGLWGRSKGNAR